MSPQRITQDPDPAKKGEKVRFTVDMDGLSPPQTFRGRFDPDGPEFQWTEDGNGEQVHEFDVPANATGGLIENDANPDFAITVAP